MILVLNGAPRNGRGGFCRSVTEEAVCGARAKRWSVTVFDLDAISIKPCRGCFACWLKHPGICAIRDDEEDILRAEASADVMVWTTPVTFGGFGPSLKKALDRMIPNILPFFRKVQGEIHHPQRYERRRGLIVLGTLPAPDAEAERIFHGLVERNALNLQAMMTRSRVLFEGTDGPALAVEVESLLGAAEEFR